MTQLVFTKGELLEVSELLYMLREFGQFVA